MDNDKYIFSSDHEIESERLKRLNEVYNDNSLNFLLDKIKPGMRVLEIGYGDGDISRTLCQKIKGIEYFGVDPDKGAVSKCLTSAQKPPNAKYFTASLTDIDSVGEICDLKFDMIFFRWVLAYTPKEHFENNIKNLYSKLNNNGLLACEECNVYAVKCVDNKDNNLVVRAKSLDQWMDITGKVDTQLNANFRLGAQIAGIVKDSTGQEVFSKAYQPVLKNKRYKQILELGLMSARKIMIANKILTEQEHKDLLERIRSEIIDNDDAAVKYVESTIGCATKK